jgi:hypothetical protein
MPSRFMPYRFAVAAAYRLVTIAALVMFGSSWGMTACAQSRKGAENQDPAGRDKEARLELMRRMIARYELFLGNKEREKLERSPDPVMRWTNPVRGASDGCLYLWTNAGRPEAIACIYPSFGGDGRGWDHEFQSLSQSKVVAERDGVATWTPEKPGVEFRRVPDSPAPADTAAQRLSQVRTLAGRFTATCIVREDKSSLRLLPTPVYRYGKPEGDVVDGGILLFVQGTDPELLLLLEARSVGESRRWEYALARVTMWGIDVSYLDVPVWSVKAVDRKSDPKQTYFTVDRVLPE